MNKKDSNASFAPPLTPVLHLTPARRERLGDILYGQILERIVSGSPICRGACR